MERRPGTCIIERDGMVACHHEKTWPEGDDFEPAGRACQECVTGCNHAP